MGMFDGIHDAEGNEWQTKALECNLNYYEIGDAIPVGEVIPGYSAAEAAALVLQMEVIGSPDGEHVWRFATIRHGFVAEVGVDRDPSLPLLGYSSGWTEAP